MAKLTINMEPLVQQSLMYCYTVGEFRERYLPILNLLNVDKYEYVNTFKHYYDMIGKKVSSGDNELLSVKDANDIIKWLNKFTIKYKSCTSGKDKIEFAQEITECLQSRNTYIENLLDESAAEKKTDPKDFLIELKMLKPYKNVKEFEPIIAALEKNREKYLEEHQDFGVEEVEVKVVDEKPVIDFVDQHKDHEWNVVLSSLKQQLDSFNISQSDLQAISNIDSVKVFESNCFESVLAKLYKKDDNGNRKKFRNLIGVSFDKTYDKIQKEMNSGKYEDGPIFIALDAQGIEQLLKFTIDTLKVYCSRNLKKSPNKKAIIAEVVSKLEQAQDKLSK